MGRLKDEALFRLIHDYLKVYLPDQRCCSPNTVKSYRAALTQLLEYTAGRENIPLSGLSLEMLGGDAVVSFLDWLTSEKKCSPRTRNHRLACISSFLAYAAAASPENASLHNSILKIPHQKTDTFSGVEYMSETAVKMLLVQPDTSSRKGIRDQFFMVLLYDTGARIQEMLDIKVCDIRSGSTPTVQLYGKGRKIRTVPLMAGTMAHFDNYMKVFHPDGNRYSQMPLFYVTQHGEKHAMSDDNVRKFLKKYGDAARQSCNEIPENIHPHLFRHSRAMHLYQHGMDLTLISQWLGHSNLETSLIYAHADTEQKRRAIEKAMGKDASAGVDIPKYSITDDELLKRLYGLK